MRVGILTGGGDVPGLNAAIRAVARRSFEHGFEVLGVKDGWKGLLEGMIEPLGMRSVSGILHVGGTILGSSRTNPFKIENGVQRVIDNMRKFDMDALVAIGGDDTLGVAGKLAELGAPAVGIPKTMDNDVYGTDYCIGFDTAVTVVADALDRLHTTAEAHHRVIVVEVMGRYTGWVATVGGLAGGADFIFIPEKPSSIQECVEHVERRFAMGKRFGIIVVSEGAKIKEIIYDEKQLGQADAFGHVRLDLRGIGTTVAQELEKRTKIETRYVVLGHLQRGGSPTVFDRVLATRLGVRAADMIKEKKFGYMAAIQGNKIVDVPLKDVVGRIREVDPELYNLAEIFY
ncbi:MAG: 6-phosphofructokinase [Chloroflexi bacterium]|nr:6-phosphofructokinase [Chloroflexota bacterium]